MLSLLRGPVLRYNLLHRVLFSPPAFSLSAESRSVNENSQPR